MPSAADTTHGACSPPAKRLPWRLSSSADWLAEIGYTIPEAIERSGAEWVAVIPQVARQLAEEE
jgi:hypothetical protein